MPFIPHTETDIQQMLESIGASDINSLFDEIPADLLDVDISSIPTGISEQGITRIMQQHSQQDAQPLCFIGAGAYEHHIPAAIWEITTRGEFYSAYTPYQAEASQGTLQLIYEYQSMMAYLTGMEVSNASLYDGASGLAEATLMAIRANRKSKSKRILMPRTVHPHYRSTAHNIVHNQNITLEELDYDANTGTINPASLPAEPGDFAALVIPQPNFFGSLEEVDALTDWAHEHGALVIAVVNPSSLALLKAPGSWGDTGADIVCGDGQPLGIPLSSGGPYFGFMCCKQVYVRQMPGRIVGRTVDLDGNPGFALTLQAREQHIRRSKATSNICTNQGLMVTAATIYMAMLGGEGIKRVAAQSHHNLSSLLSQIEALDGVSVHFDSARFHEAVLKFDRHNTADILNLMQTQGVLGGYDLGAQYPELANALLLCTTETKEDEDIAAYVAALKYALENAQKHTRAST